MDLPSPIDADVLAQPTRARLFELLSELRRAASTGELAERMGLHPNGVRVHLERLLDAGLVDRARVRLPRGRPRDEWAVASAAHPGGERPLAYADLGRWLARAIPPRPSRLRDVEAAGREIGRGFSPQSGSTPEEAVRTAFAAMGFQPELGPAPGGGFKCTLANCPYRDAVRENQEVVCTLHRGITRGLLEVVDPDARLHRFVPRDPDTAGCIVEVRHASRAST